MKRDHNPLAQPESGDLVREVVDGVTHYAQVVIRSEDKVWFTAWSGEKKPRNLIAKMTSLKEWRAHVEHAEVVKGR